MYRVDIHLSTDRQIVYVFLVFVNNAAKNIHVQFFGGHMISVLLGVYL